MQGMYDVLVVGAGPAGVAAGLTAHDRGLDVVVVDKARFPRDKPCGGGLTLRGVRLLPFDVTPVVEDVIHGFELRLSPGGTTYQPFRGPVAYMTQRRKLDLFLAEQAVAAGAEFHDGVRVRDVERRPDGDLDVLADGARARARLVIGADGANGISARVLGLGSARSFGVALEGNAALTPRLEARHRGRATLVLGSVPGGYAWVFPKGDHVNLGVGGWISEGPRMRAHLADLCRAEGVDVASLTDVRGHRLPFRAGWEGMARGRTAVVGDAAGVIDPLSGDGMFEAFVSARLAADAALDVLAGRAETLEGYPPALRRTLGGHAATAWVAKVMVERGTRVTWHILGTRAAARVLERRLTGSPLALPGLVASGLEEAARLLLPASRAQADRDTVGDAAAG